LVITPKDISTYLFCPLLYFKGKQNKFYGKLSFFEEKIKESFIAAEENALLLDSVVSVNRLVSAWDKIWWPEATKKKIKLSVSEKKSLIATQKFIDYCRYEMTDYLWPTIGTNIESQIKIGESILKCKTDLIKIDLESKNRSTVLVNFSNRSMDIREAAFDNAIRVLCYSFYSGRNEKVSHININIKEENPKIELSVSTFYPKDMKNIEKMIKHAENGIRNKISYMNWFACKECNECKQLKL
jgi:hypothetical protein